MAASPARLPHYGLAPLTADDAREMLRRVFGPDRGVALWNEACRDAGLDEARVASQAELLRMARALAMQGGAAASVARSMDIRLRTYAALAARGAAVNGGPS